MSVSIRSGARHAAGHTSHLRTSPAVPDGIRAVLAWAGLGLAVITPALVLLSVPPLVKCLVLLAFMCFGPGTALLCHVRLGCAITAWAMALVLSLSLFGLCAAMMVRTAWWHPRGVLFGLALACFASTAARVARAMVDARAKPGIDIRMPAPRSGTPGSRVPSPSQASYTPGPDDTAVMPAIAATGDTTMVIARLRGSTAEHTTAVSRAGDAGRPNTSSAAPTFAISGSDRHRRTIRRTPRVVTTPVLAGIVLFGAAVACWLVSLLLSDTSDVGDYGLLSVMHPTFFVAVGLCVLGFLMEVGQGARRGWLLVGYLVLMILILHATVPILVQEPEYAWTYKHIGVIELFRTSGRVENPHDLYQAWPALFATVAQLVTVSGTSSLRVAAWAPVFFNAAYCLPLFAAIRSLTHDRRLPYLTVFIFSCVNWVAQDYLSPQAFTYILCLGATLILLRWLPGRVGPLTVRPPALGQLWRWLHRGLVEVPYSSRRARRAALACLYVVYSAVVVSHQLSPYVLALSVAALVALGQVPSWQSIPMLFGIALLYLLPNYSVVSQYGLFDGLNVFTTFLHSTRGVGPDTTVTAGRAFAVGAVQLLSLAIWGTAAVAVVTSWERMGPVAAPAALAFAPFAVMFGQGYGGEAVYRVFLFSVPWCAYLIANLTLRLRRVPRALGVTGASVVLTAATLASIQGAHGQLTFDQFSPAEVRAMQYVYTHVPDNATLLSASANLPSRLTGNYGEFNGGADPQSLTGIFPDLAGTVTPDDMKAIDSYCAGLRDGPIYVIYMNSMRSYAHYFGYLPDGTLDSLRTALSNSPHWTAFYRSGDAVVYRFVDRPA